MQFFTKSRRGQINLVAALFAAASGMLAFFELWALALVGSTAGIVAIGLLIAENLYKSRQSAAAVAARQSQALKGLNSAVARVEATMLDLVGRGTVGSSAERAPGPSSAGLPAHADAGSALDAMVRAHNFEQWWSLYAADLKATPQTASMQSLPPVLAHVHDGQSLLMLGTAGSAAWTYETLAKRRVAVGRAYFGFHSEGERNAFESFVSKKTLRISHVSFIVQPNPFPAASLGGLSATAVDLMLVDFGAKEAPEDILATIPRNYFRWLPKRAELVVIDSRRAWVAPATSAIMSSDEDFVITIDSDDPYTRHLKRVAS